VLVMAMRHKHISLAAQRTGMGKVGWLIVWCPFTPFPSTLSDRLPLAYSVDIRLVVSYRVVLGAFQFK
jgi:hypothetical protein